MNLRKKITLGVLGLSIILLAYMSIRIWQNISYHKRIAQRIKKLPTMDVYSVGHRRKENIVHFLSGRPLVLVYFNTDCHFCQGEIRNLENNYELLKGSEFLFVSSQASGKIRKFIKNYHLSGYSSWQVVQDSLHYFKNIFGTNLYPNTYIYSSKGLLIKHFRGETSAKAINRVLNVN